MADLSHEALTPQEHVEIFPERVFTADEVEDADFQQVINTRDMVLMPVGTTRAGVIEHLAKVTPRNEFGLPIYYVRSDLLDTAMIAHQGRVSQNEVDGAIEMLSYQDGFPTLPNGSPFWVQMPHEPMLNYRLFQNYLRLDEDEGIRLLDTLAYNEGVPLEDVRAYSQEFYWTSRARAYDLFIVAAETKRREVRTRKTENKHFTSAGDLLDKILERFTSEPELIEQLSASDLFDVMEKLIKIQRLSLGLTGQNASTAPKDATPGQSVEVIVRNLMKGAGASDAIGESIQNRLTALMSDESTALAAQELIIRATSNNQIPQA